MGEKESDNVIIRKEAYRFGWKDFTLNLVFTLVMLSAFIVTILVNTVIELGEATEEFGASDWGIAIFVTIVPMLLFGNRVVKELFYTKDYITITQDKRMTFRSTPLLVTGLRVKKDEFPIIEIRKFGMTRIPRKLSLDLRKRKDKAMLVIALKNGKEFFMGEYMSNANLADICVTIQSLYPKARLTGNKDYLKLAQVNEKDIKAKKSKETEEELEGISFRRR